MSQVVEALDGAALLAWARDCRTDLETRRAEIDALNVFPIADADTGTNLLATMRAAVTAAEDVVVADASNATHVVAQALARGATLGARGNSGIILSQVLRGIAEAVRGGSLTGDRLRVALRRAAVLVRTGLSAPVEGTILTVLDRAALAAAESTDTALVVVARAAADGAARALNDTPTQLGVLRAAGVVDAGARGLLVLLDCLVAQISGEAPDRGVYARDRADRHDPAPSGRPASPDRSSGTVTLDGATADQHVAPRRPTDGDPRSGPAPRGLGDAGHVAGGGLSGDQSGRGDGDGGLGAETGGVGPWTGRGGVREARGGSVRDRAGGSSEPIGPSLEFGAAQRGHRAGSGFESADQVSEPHFEVMYVISGTDEEGANALRDRLAVLGDSVVVVGDGDTAWSAHVHCRDAGAAIEAGIAVGHLTRIRVESFAVTAPHGGGHEHAAPVGAFADPSLPGAATPSPGGEMTDAAVGGGSRDAAVVGGSGAAEDGGGSNAAGSGGKPSAAGFGADPGRDHGRTRTSDDAGTSGTPRRGTSPAVSGPVDDRGHDAVHRGGGTGSAVADSGSAGAGCAGPTGPDSGSADVDGMGLTVAGDGSGGAGGADPVGVGGAGPAGADGGFVAASGSSARTGPVGAGGAGPAVGDGGFVGASGGPVGTGGAGPVGAGGAGPVGAGDGLADRGILAVVAGADAARLFEDAGAVVLRGDRQVDAGALLAAIRGMPHREVLVLPNGALPAQELVAVGVAARDGSRDVLLLPSSSVVQGLAALAVHDRGRIAVDDAFAMSEAAATTRWGALRAASVRALTMVGTCSPGDGLGLVGHDVVVIDPDVVGAGRILLDRMLGLGGELVTLLMGAAAGPDLARILTDHVTAGFPGVEVVVYSGGQQADLVQIGVE